MIKVFVFFILSLGLWAGELQEDPSGYFSLVVPSVMLPCTLGMGSLVCPSKQPVLTIVLSKAPEGGASVALMALNSEDSIRDKPNFKMVQKETVMMDGNKTIVQTMTFNNLSNVTLPVVVRTLDSALGDKTFHMEVACNQSTCGELLGAFDEAIGSLHLAKNGQILKKEKAASGLQNLLGNFKF